MRNVLRLYVENRKVIVLTFEIFWIAVFLLEASGASSGNGIAPFVYMNF